jgi:hypothetical protein
MATTYRLYVFASENDVGKANLTLSDFEVSVISVAKSSGVASVVVDKAAMQYDVGLGFYAYFLSGLDLYVNDYLAVVRYNGDEGLDQTNWVCGPIDVDVVSRATLQAGAKAYTVQVVNQQTGQPLADADVWVTTDQAGLNIIASGKSDQSGYVTFYLDPGTVYVWKQKSGYNFSNPEQKVVS